MRMTELGTERHDDQAARREALDASRSFIVQAPAGSGKTELLTQRFLKLLAGSQQPQSVLAITFTRKATQEMKERVLCRLRQAQSGVEPEAAHERLAWDLARAVLERDRELGWNLLRNPGLLQVLTIDGLCSRLAALDPAIAASAGLPVADEPTLLYLEAARRTLEQLGQEKEGFPAEREALRLLLRRMRIGMERVQQLLADELGRRDRWLDLETDPVSQDAALTLIQQAELVALDEALGKGRSQTLLDFMAQLVGQPDESPPRQQLAAALAELRKSPSDTTLCVHACWLALGELAVGTNEPAAGSTIRQRFRGIECAGLQDIVATLADWCEDWRSKPTAKAMFKRFRSAPPLALSATDQALVSHLPSLLRLAHAQLRVLFAESGVCDFTQVAEQALQALGGEFDPGAALLLEDGRLEHLLVDEFQDTSLLQYRLLQRLLDGWQAGDGRTLFLVGDPMQSIYRFRKADVSRFLKVVQDEHFGHVAITPLRLTRNFRSRQAIVDFVNRLGPQLFVPPSSRTPGAMDYSPFCTDSPNQGQVTVQALPPGTAATSAADAVAALIGQYLAEHPDATVGVLGRKRALLEPVAAALLRMEIGFEAVEIEALEARPLVLDLLALTRALLHPADRVAWLALLRAPVCGLTVAELHQVAGERFEDEVLARLADPAVLQTLPAVLADRVRGVAETLNAAMRAAASATLKERVQAAWIRLGGPCAARQPQDLEDAQAFLSLLERIEREPGEDLLGRLGKHMQKLYAGAVGSNVRLLTIHKAKGLEFDLVVVPGMEAVGKRSGDASLFCQREVDLPDGSISCLFAPATATGDKSPGLHGYLRQLDQEEARAEDQRVLYVALTRARDRLHLVGTWSWQGNQNAKAPGARAGSFMRMLWPEFEQALVAEASGQSDGAALLEAETGNDAEPDQESGASAAGTARRDGAAGDPGLPELIPAFRLARLRSLAVELAPAPDLQPKSVAPDKDRETMALGEALHLWLELQHNHPEQDWAPGWTARRAPALTASLRLSGASEDGLAGLETRLGQLLETVALDPESRAMLEPGSDRTSWAEAEFMRATGERLERHIIDLLQQEPDGSWVVVDYKTGADAPGTRTAWREQLTRYRGVVEQATGGQVGRSLIYNVAAGTRLELDELEIENHET